MSEHLQTGNGTEAQPEVKRRRRSGTRSPNAARPAFVVLQVLDDNGQPVPFDKRHIKIVCTERSAEKVMELLDPTGEENKHPNAFYLRVLLPPGTRAGSPNRPKAD